MLWQRLAAGFGDLLMFLLFAVLGLLSHRQPLVVARVIEVALPFLLAWFVLAPLLGAFHSPVLDYPKQTAWRVPLLWLLCGIVGLLLRSWWFHRPVVPVFAAIVLVANAVLLTVWRVAFAIGMQRQIGNRAYRLDDRAEPQ